ncbi:MAG: MiaB/RimO family radical SAM methylthiotransferase, partial [Gemmatimonadota bacterium]
PGVRLYAGELPHVRYLKISEGCDHGCAFCAIPLMRGKHRSFALGDVVREAQLLEAQGAREVNLVAQDLAHYGRDVRDGNALPELLRALLRETSIPWYRLLYIYSAGLTPAMIDLIADEPRIVRYLDIPMQHAADSVLARMRRPERKARQRDKLRTIRERIPGVAIRTTVIVGFPGETEAEFEETLSAVRAVGFDDAFTFKFSPREGTPATRMPAEWTVPDAVASERLERLIDVVRAGARARNLRLLGQRREVLVEKPARRGELLQARSRDYKIVLIAGDDTLVGQYLTVELTGTTGSTFTGTVVRERQPLPVAG